LLFIGNGLKGLAEAVKEIYPRTDFQSCILHKLRGALSKVRRRDREGIKGEATFRQAFAEFKSRWGRVYPEVISSWERRLPYLMTYLRHPEGVRVYIYTDNALERVIELLPSPEVTARPLYLVAVEMNDRYRLKALRDFSLAKEGLLSIRRAKYEASQTCPYTKLVTLCPSTGAFCPIITSLSKFLVSLLNYSRSL